jgi:uncharacterized protein YxjI
MWSVGRGSRGPAAKSRGGGEAQGENRTSSVSGDVPSHRAGLLSRHTTAKEGRLWDSFDVPACRRVQMQEKLASIGDDSWIEDDQGDRVYQVDGKALRVRDTFVLKDRDGNEAASIQEKNLRACDTMMVERDGRTLATVHHALVGMLHRFDIDIEGGGHLSARGNIVDDEYEVKSDGEVIATVSKKWLRVRDTYGIET